MQNLLIEDKLRNESEYALLNSSNQKDIDESLESILEHSQRMNSIVSQMLSFARSEIEKPEFERFNICKHIQMAVKELEQEAQKMNINLIVHTPPLIEVVAEPILVMRFFIHGSSTQTDRLCYLKMKSMCVRKTNGRLAP